MYIRAQHHSDPACCLPHAQPLTCSPPHLPPNHLPTPSCLQNIRDRASAKDEMLGQVYQSRDYSNTKRRIEKELHDSLRRDKVESIQKMQVRREGGRSGQ